MITGIQATRNLFNTILPPLSYASTVNKGGVFSSAFYHLGKMGKVAVEQAKQGNWLLEFQPEAVTYTNLTKNSSAYESTVVAEYTNRTDQEQIYTLQHTKPLESELTLTFAEASSFDLAGEVVLDLPPPFTTADKLLTKLNCGPGQVNWTTYQQEVKLDKFVVIPAQESVTYEVRVEYCKLKANFTIAWIPTLTPSGQEHWQAESFEDAVLRMASIARLPKDVDLHLYSKGVLAANIQVLLNQAIYISNQDK